jgi:hypothetical protein
LYLSKSTHFWQVHYIEPTKDSRRWKKEDTSDVLPDILKNNYKVYDNLNGDDQQRALRLDLADDTRDIRPRVNCSFKESGERGLYFEIFDYGKRRVLFKEQIENTSNLAMYNL